VTPSSVWPSVRRSGSRSRDRYVRETSIGRDRYVTYAIPPDRSSPGSRRRPTSRSSDRRRAVRHHGSLDFLQSRLIATGHDIPPTSGRSTNKAWFAAGHVRVPSPFPGARRGGGSGLTMGLDHLLDSERSPFRVCSPQCLIQTSEILCLMQ